MATVVTARRGPGCLVQILWFVFIGWWLGQVAVAIAYLCMLTIIGIPLGIAIINRLPTIIALRAPGENVVVRTTPGGQAIIATSRSPQLLWPLRAVWFVLFGWWLTALWVEVAYFLCAIIIGLPLGFWMFDRTPSVLTLEQR
jgi:uncharacterized membrane protein YccF (DUF307 family)